MEIVSCVPEQKAKPGPDGTYLHIVPPATPAEDDGRFAEVMMYHHMQVIHDYFKETFAFTGLDFPLDAVVNLTIDVGGTWRSFPNAAKKSPRKVGSTSR